MKVDIFGVKIDNLTKKEISEKINSFLGDGKFHQIATVNPEFILHAQKDEEFKGILNDCDLNVADGIGIKLAFWRNGKQLKSRIAGVDLMIKMLRVAYQNKIPVFLAAEENGLSSCKETKDAILKLYPNLEINGTDLNKNSANNLKINSPSLVFCNFGAPFQEKFLNRQKNDIIGVAVGVGGSFDCLTGKLRRAPKWMQFLGIEWLWRLILQPKRIKRIWNSVIIFPLKLFLNQK